MSTVGFREKHRTEFFNWITFSSSMSDDMGMLRFFAELSENSYVFNGF